jgi:acyl-CoA thioester hydrolase
MPRIKLQEQPRYEFRYEVVLQPRDINYGGHLGHETLIALIHSARTDLLRSMGLSEMNLGDGRTGIIMVDLAVNYQGEGFMFDVIRIESHVGEMTRTSFRIFHRVIKGDKILAFVETGFLAFNYPDRKIARVPQSFLNTLNQYLGEAAFPAIPLTPRLK